MISLFHHLYRVQQDSTGFLRVFDDRTEEMRDSIPECKFQSFRVDEDKLDILRFGPVKDAGDERVEAHTFSGTGSTGNQKVRHDGQICDVDFAMNGFPEGKGQLGRRTRELF